MKITEVRISPTKGGKVRAFASIVIDDGFIVNDLRVMEGRESQVYVTMPARKARNGQMRDIAHPLNAETRKIVEERVLEEFQLAVDRLIVPDSGSGREGAGQKSRSPLDWLAAKLFSDEYWTLEVTRSDATEEG